MQCSPTCPPTGPRPPSLPNGAQTTYPHLVDEVGKVGVAHEAPQARRELRVEHAVVCGSSSRAATSDPWVPPPRPFLLLSPCAPRLGRSNVSEAHSAMSCLSWKGCCGARPTASPWMSRTSASCAPLSCAQLMEQPPGQDVVPRAHGCPPPNQGVPAMTFHVRDDALTMPRDRPSASTVAFGESMGRAAASGGACSGVRTTCGGDAPEGDGFDS